MATKPSITLLGAGAKYTTTEINTALTALQDEFANVLGVNGTSGSDNTMTGDLDMNGNTIRNMTFDVSIAGVEWQGAWVTATAYVVNDVVRESGIAYICLVAHTSGTFATDLAAVKWEIFAAAGSSGDLLASNNLSDVSVAATALTNLGGMSKATPVLGGPMTTNGHSVNFSEGSDVASATTPDIWAVDGNTVHVTGTTTINTFAAAPNAGASRWIIFDGALSLTHGAGITLPGAAAITTVAGDIAFVYADTTTAFKVVYYPVSGRSVIPPAAADTGSLVLLSTDNPSADLLVDIEGNFSSTYKHYKIIGRLIPVTDLCIPGLRVAISGTYQTSGYDWGSMNMLSTSVNNLNSASGHGFIHMTGGTNVGGATGEGFSFEINIHNPEAGEFTFIDMLCHNMDTAAVPAWTLTGGAFKTNTNLVDGIRIYDTTSSKTLTGKVSLYGVTQ